MRKFVKLKVIFSTAILLTSAFVLEAMSPEEVMPPELEIPEERTYLESEAIKRGRETMIFFHENLCNFQKSCKEMYHPYEKNIEAWYQNYIRMVSSIFTEDQKLTRLKTTDSKLTEEQSRMKNWHLKLIATGSEAEKQFEQSYIASDDTTKEFWESNLEDLKIILDGLYGFRLREEPTYDDKDDTSDSDWTDVDSEREWSGPESESDNEGRPASPCKWNRQCKKNTKNLLDEHLIIFNRYLRGEEKFTSDKFDQ